MANSKQSTVQRAEPTQAPELSAAGYFSLWQQADCHDLQIWQQRRKLQQQLAVIAVPADCFTQILAAAGSTDTATCAGHALQSLPPAAQQQILRLYLPFLSLQPGWLSPALVITQAHRAWGAGLIRLFETLWHSGLPAQIRAVIGQSCQQYHWPEPDKSSYPLHSQSPDIAFSTANLLLTLGHYPATFQAEISGACWALLHAPYHYSPVPLFPADLKHSCRELLLEMLRDPAVSDNEAVKSGFCRGYLLIKNSLQQWQACISQAAGQATPQQQMLQLLEKFGSSPCGYHKKGSLAGKPLDHWFAPDHYDSQQLLQALSQSPYVKPGQPQRSRLINQLIAADGPMFRVFTAADLSVIQQWIASLPEETTAASNPACPTAHQHQAVLLPSQLPAMEHGTGRDLRQLYHQLLHPEQFPSARAIALQYCQKWLHAHQIGLHRGDAPLPMAHYDAALFATWVEQQHARQVQSYRPLQGPPELCVSELKRQVIQLLPFVLIDGAWLRGFTQPRWLHCDIGRLLLRTYLDELGNGHTELHHGNIYRALVESMGYCVADFTTAEFVQLDLFQQEDFEVPVFWLSISLFPKQFLAELLGLNLAMELSGIGGDYRRAGDILRFYGFSSQFNELHNSIDNIVTGHTGWAVQAIQLFMEQHQGSTLQTQYWHRIWTGYRALKPPGTTQRLLSQIPVVNRVLTKN